MCYYYYYHYYYYACITITIIIIIISITWAAAPPGTGELVRGYTAVSYGVVQYTIRYDTIR